MAKGFADWSILQRTVSIRSIIKYFGTEIEGDMCRCPFHKDKNPSMIVNTESCWCFACGKGWNIFQFVAEKLHVSEDDAYRWIELNSNLLPAVEGVVTRKRGEYLGPVDKRLIEFWHNCLDKEHRKILYEKRLLTDDTIDLNLIGWRPDYKAFSVPFWQGTPQQSDIEIVQFRLTNESPDYVCAHSKDSKFTGLSGHNKPSFINRHLLTEKWAVVLIGTFDALLAGQDGFPAISPNGASTFSSKKHSEELVRTFEKQDHLFVVYDATVSEQSAVDKMVGFLEAAGKEVTKKYFTEDSGKDYGDYRYYGNSASDFYRYILEWSIC